MASSSTHSFLLLFPLLLLLSTVVDSGSAPTPAPAATAEKYQKWCQVASDSQSCIKVIESIPGIQEVDYNNASKVADLCMHFAANKTTEAKGAADTLLAAAKGKPSSCLKACATNIKSMAEVLVNLPAGQDDMNAYLTYKGVSEPSSKTRNHQPARRTAGTRRHRLQLTRPASWTSSMISGMWPKLGICRLIISSHGQTATTTITSFN